MEVATVELDNSQSVKQHPRVFEERVGTLEDNITYD